MKNLKNYYVVTNIHYETNKDKFVMMPVYTEGQKLVISTKKNNSFDEDKIYVIKSQFLIGDIVEFVDGVAMAPVYEASYEKAVVTGILQLHDISGHGISYKDVYMFGESSGVIHSRISEHTPLFHTLKDRDHLVVDASKNYEIVRNLSIEKRISHFVKNK